MLSSSDCSLDSLSLDDTVALNQEAKTIGWEDPNELARRSRVYTEVDAIPVTVEHLAKSMGVYREVEAGITGILRACDWDTEAASAFIRTNGLESILVKDKDGHVLVETENCTEQTAALEHEPLDLDPGPSEE